MSDQNNNSYLSEQHPRDTFSHSNQLPIKSKDLIGAREYLEILHEGHIYRLRITKLKKLILTK
jgi:hemin uptake protein HemP